MLAPVKVHVLLSDLVMSKVPVEAPLEMTPVTVPDESSMAPATALSGAQALYS